MEHTCFQRKMSSSSLGITEITIYFIIWISANLYGLFYLFIVQEETLKNGTMSLEGIDLARGWKSLSRNQDISDVEWITWIYGVQMCCVPMIIHFVGGEIIRKLHRSLLLYWYIVYPTIFLFMKYGITYVLIIFLQPTIYITTMHIFHNRTAIWIVGVLNLVLVNSLKYSEFLWNVVDNTATLNDEDVYLLLAALCWMQIRNLSFCLDQINYRTLNEKNSMPKMYYQYFSCVAYSIYLPTLHMGPVIMYSDFKRSLSADHDFKVKLKKAIIDLSILSVYTVGLEYVLHFIYFLALSSNNMFVQNLPSMALCGAGLWMGVQFHLKYTIMYGTTSAFARLDNIEAPPTPRCIMRIHLYSQMWKYFDVGLYTFLLQYIYKPVIKEMENYNIPAGIKKAVASASPFVFVYVWHGATLPIFIWTVLNYSGIMLEKLGPIVKKTETYAYFYKTVLKSKAYEERFLAIISTPLLITSALSNFYLFAGLEVGNIFVKRFFSASWYNLIFIYTCLYTCCAVSAILYDVPSRTARYKENRD